MNGTDSGILAAAADTAGLLDPRNAQLTPRIRQNWRDAVEARRKYPAHPPGTFEKIARDTRAMHEAGIPFLAGTDVGGIPLVYPGSSLHHELQLLVKHGGLTPLQALQAATRNSSRFLGLQNEIGTVEVGKMADLVLLEANPLQDIGNVRRIRAVVAAGRFLDRATLDGLTRIAQCVENADGVTTR